MNKTLEQKILARMLQKPDEVRRHTLKAEWFLDTTHRQLAYTLLNTEEKFNDFSEIEFEVKEYYPKSDVTEEWLHAIKFEEMFIDNLEHSIKALEAEFVQHKVNDAMIDYLNYASKRNKEIVEDWLRIQADLEVVDKNGDLEEPIKQLLHELEHESEEGIKSYFKLDTILGSGLKGEILFVLAARPGLGKTTYSMNIVLEALQKDPEVHVDFFSLEMGATEILKKLVSRMTHINSYKFNNAKIALNDDEKKKVIWAADWLNKTNLKIHDDKFDISEIERTIRQRHYEADGKKYMAVVDYVGLVTAGGKNDQRYREIGIISRTLKMLTQTLKIPIILISQLNRRVEERSDKRPNLADLRESGDLEQDANVVGLLSAVDVQDLEDRSTELLMRLDIAKNRGGMSGEVIYAYDKKIQYFGERKDGY